MGPNDDLGGLRTDQTAKAEVGKWLEIGVVTLVKGVVKIQHKLPVVGGETDLNVHDGELGVFDGPAGGFAALHCAVVAELQIGNPVKVTKCRHLKVRSDRRAVLNDLRRCLTAQIGAAIWQDGVAVSFRIDIPISSGDLQVITGLPSQPQLDTGLLGVADIFYPINQRTVPTWVGDDKFKLTVVVINKK